MTEALGRAGASVTHRELPADFNALIDAHPIVMNSESARALGWELATHPDQISESLRERLDFGLNQTQSALENAYTVFETTQRAFPAAMDGPRHPGHARRPRRGPKRPGVDRRPGLQLHLDLAARPLRHRPRRHRPQRPAARHPDRRPPRR